MKLDCLEIRGPRSWDPKDAGYRGTIKFTGESGSVELKLGKDISEKLLAVVADLVVEAGKSVARDLTAETINVSGPALTHQESA